MNKRTGALILAAAVAVGACANETPQQKHEVGCTAGTLTGAVLGGVVGSAFGGGIGETIMTGVGAAAGGYAGNRLACG